MKIKCEFMHDIKQETSSDIEQGIMSDSMRSHSRKIKQTLFKNILRN